MQNSKLFLNKNWTPSSDGKEFRQKSVEDGFKLIELVFFMCFIISCENHSIDLKLSLMDFWRNFLTFRHKKGVNSLFFNSLGFCKFNLSSLNCISNWIWSHSRLCILLARNLI